MSRRKRRRRTRRVILTLGVLGLLAAAVVVWQLSWQKPDWWAPPEAADERVAEVAQQIEYSLIEQAHTVRADDEPWSVRIHDRHVNAWLASRLPSWLAHAQELDWPAGFGQPQVRFEPGSVTVAIELAGNGRQRFVAVRLVPSIVADQLRLVVDQVSLGKLTLPGKPIGEVMARLKEAAPSGFVNNPEVQVAMQWLLGGRSLDPVATLADGRIVRLVAVRCEEGAVVMQCRTISGSASADHSSQK